MKSTTQFDQKQATLLSTFLDTDKSPSGAMSYWESVGFLFVVTCSPELVQPSQWLPVIFGNESDDGKPLEASPEILVATMALYNELNRQVQESDVALLTGCEFREDSMENINEDAPISQWAKGFVQGYHWLERMWDVYVPAELKQEANAQMVVLSFFGSANIAQTCLDETTKQNITIETMATNMQAIFVDAMKGFAYLGYTIQQAFLPQSTTPNLPARREKIGRNEPCLCGSGKKFKKCCGVVVV